MIYVNARVNVMVYHPTMETPLILHLMEQIERCRRLADEITDKRATQALRDLACDYEAQIAAGTGSVISCPTVRAA
jgi:hypothetical protein